MLYHLVIYSEEIVLFLKRIQLHVLIKQYLTLFIFNIAALCISCISPATCEENIRLMFTVLERSTLPVVRANAIIALGDLIVRFPNILEPWTQNLYAR